MKSQVLLAGLIATFALSAQAASPASPQQTQKKSGSKSKPAQQSLTGCVDERDGRYVLLDDQMLHKIADLQSVGAEPEAVFAKHLGHKVIVKGSKSSEQENPVFRVTSIEEVSGVCAPAGGAQ
jgi:hypothetical protein